MSLARGLRARGITLAHGAWLCLLAGLGLALLGIYAIDLGASVEPPRGATDLSPLAIKQGMFLAVGLLAAGVVALPHYRALRLATWPAMAISVGLLLFLLLPFVPHSIVAARNGVRGWIDLGPVDLQPAELAKIAFVLAAADYLRFRKNHRTFAGLLPPAAIMAVPIGLIFLQPDLGSASLFVPAMFAILLAAGARLKHLTIVVLLGALAAPAAYPLLKPYQKQRIVGLVHQLRGDRSQADGITYQSDTAIMLAGAGGLAGFPDAKARALVHHAELPERHNDMIFSVIMLRFGLLGALAVAALYGLWLLGAFLTAAACKDAFGRLVVVGFVGVVAVQATVNVGMVVGVLPVVGLTLPFVSYGGSSMVSVWLMTGLIFNIASRRPPILARPTFEFDDD